MHIGHLSLSKCSFLLRWLSNFRRYEKCYSWILKKLRCKKRDGLWKRPPTRYVLIRRAFKGRPLPPPRPSLDQSRAARNNLSRRPSSSVKSGKASKTSSNRQKTPQIEASEIEESHDSTVRRTPQVKENDTREGSSSQLGSEQNQQADAGGSNQSCLRKSSQRKQKTRVIVFLDFKDPFYYKLARTSSGL